LPLGLFSRFQKSQFLKFTSQKLSAPDYYFTVTSTSPSKTLLNLIHARFRNRFRYRFCVLPQDGKFVCVTLLYLSPLINLPDTSCLFLQDNINVECTNYPGGVGGERTIIFKDAVADLRPEHIRLGDVTGAERGSVALGEFAVMPNGRNVIVRGTMTFFDHPVTVYGPAVQQKGGVRPRPVGCVVLDDNISPAGGAVVAIFTTLSVADALTNIDHGNIGQAIADGHAGRTGIAGFTVDGRPLMWVYLDQIEYIDQPKMDKFFQPIPKVGADLAAAGAGCGR
jgi:hypothetical protein